MRCGERYISARWKRRFTLIRSPRRLPANPAQARPVAISSAGSPRVTAGTCMISSAPAVPTITTPRNKGLPAASRCCSPAASSCATGTARRCCRKARCSWSRPDTASSARTATARATAACRSGSTPKLFERIAHDAGARPSFAHNRLPPLRACRALTARARIAIDEPGRSMEESRSSLPAPPARLPAAPRRKGASAHHHGRMTEVLRYMAEHSAAPHTLAGLARMARMSPYHFLRSFKATTGVTPHQWLLRARLRKAAEQLATTSAAGDRHRARRRVRRPVEFHPHVPRGIRRLAAAIPAGGIVSGARRAIFSKFSGTPVPTCLPSTKGRQPCSITSRSACATSPAPSASTTRRSSPSATPP